MVRMSYHLFIKSWANFFLFLLILRYLLYFDFPLFLTLYLWTTKLDLLWTLQYLTLNSYFNPDVIKEHYSVLAVI